MFSLLLVLALKTCGCSPIDQLEFIRFPYRTLSRRPRELLKTAFPYSTVQDVQVSC